MSDTVREIDWQTISAALRQPFNPADVDFRPQGKPGNGGNVQVVAYVDARTVMARLDEACGPGGWSFTYEPIVVANGQVQIAKGRLEIHGVVREDVGEASNFDPSKGCVSDTLKRVAVQFGVGRYLYDIERTWVKAQGDRLSDETIAHLRSKLPRPDGVAPARPASPPARRDTPSVSTDTPSPAEAVSRPPQRDVHKGVHKPVDPDAPATAEQRERMRKYRDALEIADRSIATTDNALTVAEAEARICAYIEQWKKRQMRKSPATPAAAAEHDLSTLGNGGGRH